MIPPGHPLLAVVAPHRVRDLCARVGLDLDGVIEANFTGWCKLVVLGPDVAVLVPRNHTMVDPLAREVRALGVLAPHGIAAVPAVREVIDDPDLGPYPFVVCDRLPGVPLADVIEQVPPAELAALFADLGRRIAGWHAVPPVGTGLPGGPRPASSGPAASVVEILGDLGVAAANRATARAASLDKVVVHGDLHEGQLLVDPTQPDRVTGVLDWQTARIDHPFVDFDLGEWGTAMWRAHRRDFAALRSAAWSAYADARGLPDDLGPTFELFHAASHLRRVAGPGSFPVAHQPGIVGSIAEARAAVDAALAAVA